MNNFNGERLKLARIYRNMTASELAEKIGVTRQAVLQYEKNENNPKNAFLGKNHSFLAKK